MSTLFIAILLIIAVFLALFKCRKSCTGVLLFTLISFLAIGDGLLSFVLTNSLQRPFINLSSPQWKNKNAIVLLGAGVTKLPATDKVIPAMLGSYSRMYETARLYMDCVKHHKCTIIISGGDPLKTGKSEAVVYRDALLALGINNSDIKLESNSMNTYQNAKFTSSLLKKEAFEQVILVTSDIHLRRSLLYFSHFGVKAKPALADYLQPQLEFIPRAYNFALTDLAIHEYLGIAKIHLYNFLGWSLDNKVPGMP